MRHLKNVKNSFYKTIFFVILFITMHFHAIEYSIVKKMAKFS